MIDDFFDWILDPGHEFISVMFVISLVLFICGLAIAFILFAISPRLLRFEALMATIMFSIFITWYLRVRKNSNPK